MLLRSLALLQSLNASLSDMAHASRQMRRAAMDCAQQARGWSPSARGRRSCGLGFESCRRKTWS
ncbi:unnamed protein product [Effrenium voratum]|nr:unnamed protein product [Effrenium voratum]